MRRTPQPRPHSRDAAAQHIQPPVKKVFNCIVDETALLAGAKKSTRDGIRKWIGNEQIRLFVPLYTLNQATRLKDKATGRVRTDSEEALSWLDEATSDAPHLVTLQGGFERFDTWAEVEKFALPKPLFSEEDLHDYEDDVDDLTEQTESKLSIASLTDKQHNHLSMSSAESDASRSDTPDSLRSMRSSASPVSPPESPAQMIVKPHSQDTPAAKLMALSAPANPTNRNTNPSDSGVPPHLRPLFNYILWRVQQEIDPAAALESFIFLCDDPNKAKLAQRFGIRVKSLADIRFVVAREEREFRNRQLVQKKENEKLAAGGRNRPPTRAAAAAAVSIADEKDMSDDDEEVLFKRPPKAPAAMIAAQQSPRLKNKVLDPNQFTRSPAGPTRGTARGRGSKGAARGGAGAGAGAGAGRRSPTIGRADPVSAIAVVQQTNGPIDPDSFRRPPPTGGRVRGGRKLFVPT